MPARTGAAVVATCCLAVGARAAEIVDWRDAAQCVGRVCGVRGTVAASEADGPTTRLYFDPQERTVRVVLMHGWLVTWPAYDGRAIVATGRVDRFRDHIEMILVDPRDIEVAGGLPSPTAPAPLSPTPSVPLPTPTASIAMPTPVPTAPPATAGGEVEQLRERVRELEERVRELEE
jgi:hypothetical protein